MKTFLKIVLGIILVLAVLIVGCTVIVGKGVNDLVDEIEDDANKPAITQTEYRSVKVGRNGNTRKRIEDRFGEPQTQKDVEDRDAEAKPGLDCLYYNKEGELGGLYQFCFDKNTQRVRSKASL